ncbi:Protein of unknown function [Pyronema omphalodes CBS 100304]|uniref:Uncharacterized protein n=1 Tax=Pyronema omphalodes (strain CBS 100304) TaxID=1076935 RepID=U4L1C2_PYROM|nr:Protein of unknown function [Pyronema omphalodes CBS 100304]
MWRGYYPRWMSLDTAPARVSPGKGPEFLSWSVECRRGILWMSSRFMLRSRHRHLPDVYVPSVGSNFWLLFILAIRLSTAQLWHSV